jgi:hypothetical protein
MALFNVALRVRSTTGFCETFSVYGSPLYRRPFFNVLYGSTLSGLQTGWEGDFQFRVR